jgi:flagellar biosynthesis/type III secretory pathway protein FliH
MAKTKDDFKMQRDAAHGISSSEPKVKEKRSMKYLDPKTDLTFKKIFYKHPDLLISLLNEIDTNTEQVPTELKENPEIQKALEELKVTGFTEEELRAYEKLLDNIRVERTLQQDSYEKGVEEGMEKGIEQGVEIGLTKGQNKEKFTIAQKMLSAKLPYSQIIAFTGLTEEQLKEILDEGFTI